MRLLLDLGNTRIKWLLLDAQGQAMTDGAAAWSEGLEDDLGRPWLALPLPRRIWAASVVDPEREARITQLTRDCFRQQPDWLRTPVAACGVSNGYTQPERLGIDRFLAMIAARADYPGPTVIASIGTALALDAIDADGRHLGGLIAPGPRLMQQSVLGATAQVRLQQQGHLVPVATNTEDGLMSGSWQACIALIERFHGQIERQLGQPVQLRLAGGDAAPLPAWLSQPSVLRIDSVLQGLAIWSASLEMAAQASPP
ncbi:type III pantothenate kinase [Frateuria aurantia]